MINIDPQDVPQARLDFGATFRTDHGQRVLHRLGNWFGLFKAHTGTDPIDLAIQEGRRQVILTIIDFSAPVSMEEQSKQLLKEVLNG